MKCPKCQTENEEGSQFCLSCGAQIGAAAARAAQPLARSPRQLLGIMTLRAFLSIVGLVVIRAIVLRLPFTQGVRITGAPFTVETLISAVIYFIALLILVAYARSLSVLWPRAYPRFVEAGTFFSALVFIGVLVAAYYAFLPIVYALGAGPEVISWIEIGLLILSIALLAWAGIALYRFLPSWLSTLRLSALAPGSAGIACLNCGHINSEHAVHCISCGSKLSAE